MVTSLSRDGQHALLGRGVSVWYQSLGCSPVYLENFLVSSVRTIPPRREPHRSDELSFPDIAQLGEAIVNVIQSII